MVGVRGFEPPASCSQSKRSSQAELHPDYHIFICIANKPNVAIYYIYTCVYSQS